MFKSIRRNKRDMLAALDCKPTSAKMAGHSTLEYVRPDGVTVTRFHETDVVMVDPDGTITLNTGGFLTPTTKLRLNDALPSGMGIYAEKGVWWLCANGQAWDKDAERYPFADGMQVKPDGTILGSDPELPGRIKELTKKITKFCRAINKFDRLPLPDSGDCFICRMPNPDCLEQHLDEMYIHGTLIHNAMKEDCTSYVIDASFRGSLDKSFAVRAVRKYLKRNLGLAS